jgi:hypothetical protein
MDSLEGTTACCPDLDLTERLQLYDDLQEFLCAFDFSSDDDPAAIGVYCPCNMLETNLFAQECTHIPADDSDVKVANRDVEILSYTDHPPSLKKSGSDRKRKESEGEVRSEDQRARKMLKVSDIFDFPTVRYVI